MRALKKAVLRTLHYSDIFDYPVTEEEIYRYLLYQKSSKQALREVLEDLVDMGLIGEKDGFFYLNGRDSLPKKRLKREEISARKWLKVRNLAESISKFPFIESIVVTGTLARDNSEEEDDLDLLIITSGQRLWSARIFLVLYLLLTGQYRRKHAVQNRVCPNVWITLDHLQFAPENIFVAHEIAQSRVVYGEEVYNKFIVSNSWITKVFPNITLPSVTIGKHRKPKFIFGSLGGWLEKLVFWAQYVYMKPRISTEKVSLTRALFHPAPVDREILNDYRKRGPLIEQTLQD
jgi:predicted nucleotidyltransferase